MFADSILSGRNSFLGVAHQGNGNTGEGKGLHANMILDFVWGKRKEIYPK